MIADYTLVTSPCADRSSFIIRCSGGDYAIVRTGMMERCQKAGSWDGYPGGDAPGFAFESTRAKISLQVSESRYSKMSERL